MSAFLKLPACARPIAGVHARRRRVVRRRGRQHHRPDRAERLGQEHGDRLHLGLPEARRRQGRAGGPRHHRPAAPPHRPRRPDAHLPDGAHLRALSSLRDNLGHRRPAVRPTPPGSTSSCAPAATARRVGKRRGARPQAGRADRPDALLRARDRHPVLRPEEAGGACRRADAASEDRGARRAGGRRQSEPHPRDRGGAAQDSTAPARPS